MRIFINKNVKIIFCVVAAILLCFVVLAQVTVKIMSDDYKNKLLDHDYMVAGRLYSALPEKQNEIVKAFTGEKSERDLDTGVKLLKSAAYTNGTVENIIPNFRQSYSIQVLIFSVVFSLAILIVLYIFLTRHYKKIEEAYSGLCRFMDGDLSVRLNADDEGALSMFFNSVNAMATSLTAHIAKEKQSKEFLRDTISDISHQLKTPLAALQMYNEIIQSEKTGNDTVDNFAGKSANELQRMENLVKNLLKLARLDAGSIQLEKSDVVMKDFLERSLNGLKTRAQYENKTLEIECSNTVTLCCDEEWMAEAVSNIVKNALDHTEAGNSVQIVCDETQVVKSITIKDNGKGIHPEDLHHIFKRFFRSRFSKDRQGIGIGLTLSKAVIEKHGGSITVESQLGKGTIFRLIFPKLTNL